MFPVQRLFPNITVDLRKYAALHIPDAIAKGLINEVNVIDEDCGCTNFANIGAIQNADNTLRFQVTLSASFCQVIWILCDILLRSADYFTIKEIIDRTGGLDAYIKENNTSLAMSDEECLRVFSDILRVPEDVKKFKAQLVRSNKLMTDQDLMTDLDFELSLAMLLLQSGSQRVNPDDFKNLDMEPCGYGESVNALCVKSLAFILLHELHHCYLEHFTTPGTILAKEWEADDESMRKMYDSCPNEEKFTVGVALLLLMIVNLFINPDLNDDGVHPRDDIRLFNVYDYIQKDNPKYRIMLVHAFNLWSSLFKKKGSPAPLNVSEETSVISVREYLNTL